MAPVDYIELECNPLASLTCIYDTKNNSFSLPSLCTPPPPCPSKQAQYNTSSSFRLQLILPIDHHIVTKSFKAIHTFPPPTKPDPLPKAFIPPLPKTRPKPSTYSRHGQKGEERGGRGIFGRKGRGRNEKPNQNGKIKKNKIQRLDFGRGRL